MLNYHRVGTSSGQPWDPALWSASAEALDAQVAFLRRHAEIVGPAELRDLRPARAGRLVALTFDDGYRDNYELAFPILRSHGATAAFFIATGFVDRPRAAWWDEIAWMVRHATRPAVAAGGWLPGDVVLADRAAATVALVERYKTLDGERSAAYLDHVAAETGAGRCPLEIARDLWVTWDMVRELRDAGMTIGGHTIDHPILASLSRDEQEREIGGCLQRLEAELGEPARWFAYPVGARTSFDADTRALMAAHGIELAFSFYGGYRTFADWDPYDVRRIHVGPDLSQRRFEATVTLPQVFVR